MQSIKKIIVSPTADTVALLQGLFQASPFDIDWDTLHVELGSTEEIPTPKPSVTYQAVPSSMDIWYDVPTGMSYLILPIFPSKKMADRHAQIGDVWGRRFVPYMVIAPAPSLRHRGFINSIATGLVDRSPRLTFGDEFLLDTYDTVPAHNGFYADFIARGRVSNQLFLEEDEGIE